MADVAERNAGALRLRADQVGIDLELRLGMGLPIAGKAFRTRQQRGAAGEQRDAAMAEPDKISRDFETTSAMIRTHRGNARHLAIDRDAGQVQVCERAGEAGMGVVAGEQQQAVHPPPSHRLARARAQRLRRRMRLEAQAGHGPHDAGVQFRADMRLAVHDAADAAHRNAGLRRDVANGGTCGLCLARRRSGASSVIAAVAKFGEILA